MINAVASESEILLTPGEIKYLPEPTAKLDYNGDLYVSSKKRIKYGICYGIAIEKILSFLDENRCLLKNAGYNIDDFF